MKIKNLKLNNSELLSIFPEAKGIIPEKMKEWESKRTKIVKCIKHNLILIRDSVSDKASQLFWREVLKMYVENVLLECNSQLMRLKRLLLISKGQTSEDMGWISDDTIQKALAVSMEDIVSKHTELKKTGANFRGLCPLHDENTPSFYIYTNSNRFKCYGCGETGDVISLARLLHNCSFKEAIEYLIGGK